MFAIIQTGGKQYQISPDQTIEIEKLEGKIGDKIVFDKVLLISDQEKTQVGTPYLTTKIEGKIEAQIKAKKIKILRFKAKSRYRRRQGHRQQLTVVTIGKFGFEKIKTAKATTSPVKDKKETK